MLLGMLIWTASTRPAVDCKSKLILKKIIKKSVDFINGEINNCEQSNNEGN